MKKLFESIFITAIVSSTSFAQLLPQEHHTLNFDHYIYSEATPFVPANVVIQDKQGYMWFGTQWGVYRYDGYSSDHFNSDSNVNPQIIQNEVNALVEDHTGALWVGTNGGLTRIDPTHQNSIHFLNNPNHTVRKLFQSNDKTIWIGTDKGLQSIHPETYEINNYKFDSTNPNSLPELLVLSIAEDTNGFIWVSFHISRYSSALVRLDTKNNSVVAFYTPKESDMNPFLGWKGTLHPTVYISYINSICVSNTGDLWLGSWLGRLAKFNPITFEFERRIPQNYSHQDLHRNVNKIIEDSEGMLWITSEELGISRYEPQTNSAWVEIHDRFRSSSISDFNISDIYFDTFQNLWVLNSGVIDRLDPNKHNVREFHFREGHRYATVYRDILEDNEGKIWMATAEGLHRFSLQTLEFTSFYDNPGQENSLSDNNVTSISLDNKNQLWVGTNARGVQVIDLETLTITPFELFPEENSSNKGHIHDIEIDRDGVVWFATRYSGIVSYDPKTEEYEYIFMNPVDSAGGSRLKTIHTIYSSENGIIWFGELNAGLYRYEKQTNTFTYYPAQLKDPNQLFGNNINDIVEDKNGNLWIATDKAVNIYDIETGKFKHLTRDDGLPPSSIQSLIYNDDETIWLSSKNNGIFIINIATNEIEHFYTDPHNPVNTFDENSSWKGKDGTLYFGSILNLISISPELQKQVINPTPPKVIIKSIRVLGKMYFDNDIHLGYWQNTITVKYSVVHFTNPSKNRSKYSFSEDSLQEDNWIEADGRNTVNFYDLAPGSYKFKLIGANNDGIWTKEPTTINIVIAAPFWVTWWFRLFCLITIIFLTYLFIKWRLYSIHRKNIQLENQVQIRTSELVAERDYSHQITESSPSVIFGYYPDGTVSFLNPSARRLFDLTNQEFPTKSWWELAKNSDEQDQLHRIFQRSQWGEQSRFESTFTGKNMYPRQIDWIMINRYNKQGEIDEIIVFGNDITERIEKEVIEVSNREQKKIGQEIHDSLCQQLAGISLMCESLIRRKQPLPDKDLTVMKQIRNHIRRVTTHSRNLAHGLYLHELEQSGLHIAIRELTENIQELFSIPCEWICKTERTVDDFDQAVHVYRIVQEALSNAVKYSQSQRIQVMTEESDHHLIFRIVDSGTGFEINEDDRSGMGINVMWFRARIINATLNIQSKKGEGTTVLLKLP